MNAPVAGQTLLVIAGATGMVGGYALRHALDHQSEEHWVWFREARGGPVAFYSEEGTKIDLDERPIIVRLHQDLERGGNVPVRETITKLAAWLAENGGSGGHANTPRAMATERRQRFGSSRTPVAYSA